MRKELKEQPSPIRRGAPICCLEGLRAGARAATETAGWVAAGLCVRTRPKAASSGPDAPGEESPALLGSARAGRRLVPARRVAPTSAMRAAGSLLGPPSIAAYERSRRCSKRACCPAQGASLFGVDGGGQRTQRPEQAKHQLEVLLLQGNRGGLSQLKHMQAKHNLPESQPSESAPASKHPVTAERRP